MPFTPFHFGPAILIGLILYRYLDFPTFVAANVLTDWRAFLVFFGVWPGPRHSWVHTYVGSFACALVFAGAMIYLRPYLQPWLEKFRVDTEFSNRKIIYSSLVGVTVHITLDAFHHPTMNPFYPIMDKPLYGLMPSIEVTLLAFALGICAVPVYGWHLAGRPVIHKKKTQD